IIEWTERLRADSLYVPEMKELMRGEAGKTCARAQPARTDAAAIQVLQTPAGTAHIEEEDIPLVGRAAHDAILFRHNLFESLRAAVVVRALVIPEECRYVITASDAEHTSDGFPHQHRGIGQCIVVRRFELIFDF